MIKQKFITIIFLVLIGGNVLISCSKGDELKEKTFTLKFDSTINSAKIQKQKIQVPAYTLYKVKINSEGKPIVDKDKLTVIEVINKENKVKINSEGKPIVDKDKLTVIEVINKENGLKSYAVYKKNNGGGFSLKNLQLSMKTNSEWGGIMIVQT